MNGTIAPISGARAPVETPPPANDAPDPVAPSPKPYRFNVATGLGIGGGAVAGGMLGFLGGGIAQIINDGRRVMDPLFNHAPAGLAVVGAVIGGVAGYALLSANHRSNERSRIDRNFGIGLHAYATELVAPYDHNANGQIDLTNATGLVSTDERVVTRDVYSQTRTLRYDWWEDDFHVDRGVDHQVLGTSAANIWSAANANHDDSVSQSELRQLLAAYDSDGSRTLTRGERERFATDHPLVSE